jgi:pyruvate dehydrogenase (quinone)
VDPPQRDTAPIFTLVVGVAVFVAMIIMIPTARARGKTRTSGKAKPSNEAFQTCEPAAMVNSRRPCGYRPFMAQITSEVLIGRLAEWGVDTVFGIPGDGINGIMEGLRRQRDKIKFVLVHHEEAAAFMATAYAKQTGRIGVCLATSGPGAIHLLNGLYDAKLDHAPVLAITGMQETSVLGTGYQQEVHLEHLFEDLAEYNQMIVNPAQLPSLVDIAIRTAYARRGVAHLTVPNDIQIADAGANPYEGVAPARAPQTAPVYLASPVRPADDQLREAADILNAAEKPAILAGIGARGAGALVESVAQTLAAPVIKTLSGKMVLPDDSPYTTSGIGLLGTAPSADLVDDVDTLFMVGTNFPYTKHLPEPGKVKVVQIEADPTRVGNRMPTDVPLIGDASATLTALLPLLTPRENKSHLERYQKLMREWREKMAALESPDRDPIAPQYVVRVLDEVAADDAIMTCDSGTIATWAARHWQIRGSREFYLSGNLATMAPGLPYAIAMAHANPGRQTIAYIGDGGFAMLMAEFNTACRYGLPVKVVINNNSSLGQILWEQMVLGYPEHGVRFGEPQPDYAAWARACGGHGTHVAKAEELPGAVAAALAHDGPALVDVAVDPDEPPMPGKVTYDQAKKFAEAFLKGQPHKASIASTLFKDRIQQLKA